MDLGVAYLIFIFFIDIVIATTMEKANQFLAQNRLSEAVEAYSEVLQKEPKNYQALYRRATVYQALGKTRNAIPDLTAVLEIRPDFKQAQTERGKIYIKQGKYDLAEEDFKNDAAKRNEIQTLKEADQAYHAAMYKENSFEEAIIHLTTLLEKSPWNIEYLEARASCYEHRGKFSDAILDLRPTTKLNPDNTKAWFKISSLYYAQGHVEQSLESVRECLRLDQDHKACGDHYKKVKKLNKHLVAANEAAQKNNWKKTFESLESAESANKDNIVQVQAEIAQLRCRGVAFVKDEAGIEYCNKAIELDDNHARTYVKRSELHTVLGNYEEAIADLEKAKEIDNNYTDIERLIEEAKKRLKQSQKRDYYKILGVNRKAKKKEIKKAYREKAAKAHPDVFNKENPDATEEERKKAEKHWLDVAAAFEVLTDDEMRQQFDAGKDPLDAEQVAEDNRNPFQGGFNPFRNAGRGGGGQKFHFHF